MRLIRKGNDIGVVWSIYAEQDGSTVAYSLEGRNLSLFLESGKNRYEITDFTVSGNAMSFTFWGKDQIACGAYFLTLVENKGLEDMRVLDYKNAFAIVRHSWEAGGEDNPNITIETVELSSNIGEIIDERLIPNTIARVADVNALLAGYLPLSGGVMSGDVNMNGNYISGVHAPIEDDDAVNKQYVDSGIGALDNSIQNLSNSIGDIQEKIPSAASASNKLADKQYVIDKANELNDDITGVASDLDGVDVRLQQVEGVIPSAASSSNQLADKAFVNSSIATSTATFRGTSPKLYTESTFLEWANAISSKDANDYVFWWTEDAAGNTVYKRYKYTGSGWLFEYNLNNSSFTAAQWAAINSLMTSALTGKLVELPTAQQLAASFNAKQDTLVSGTNIKTINNQSLLGGGNIEIQGGGGTNNLFIAEYAVTRVSEIIDAYNAGKDIVAKKTNDAGGYDFYQLLGYNDSAIQFDFYAIDDSTIKRIYIVDQGGETAEEEWGIGITTNLNKSDIFWATYNLTTLAQVQSAINSGKLVFVKVDGIALHCPGITSDVAVFTSFVLGYGYISVSLNSNGWEQVVITNPEFQNNKVTSIGAASSDIQYPSAKCMYDALSGKQATINTVNVSVLSTTGTPSGTASVSGSTMNLSFTGIKGEKGDTGTTGPQGPQGNTGSSVDYPFELVNNLTTDDATKALASAQGVVLEGEISQLSQEVDEIINGEIITTVITLDDIDGDGAKTDRYLYYTNGRILNAANCIVTRPIYLNVGDKVDCQTGGTGFALFAKSPNSTLASNTGYTGIASANSSQVTTYSTTITEAGWYVFSGRINRQDGTNLVVRVEQYQRGESGIYDLLNEKADKGDVYIPSVGLSIGADKVKDDIPASPWFDTDANSTGMDYGTYLDDKLDTVPIGKRFIFITDVHYEGGNKNAAELIDYARRRLGIKTIIHGGDVHNEAPTAEAAVANWLAFNRDFVFRIGNDFKQVLGDHDRNAGTGHAPISYGVMQRLLDGYDSSELVFDNLYDQQVAGLGWSAADMAQYNAFKRMHYYFDDLSIKTRFIVLVTRLPHQNEGLVYEKLGDYDSGVLLLQMDFLHSALLTAPNGYNVIVCGHNVVGNLPIPEHSGWYDTTTPGYKGYWKQVVYHLRAFMTKGVCQSQYLNWESSSIGTKTFDYSEAKGYGIVFCYGGDVHWDILAKAQPNNEDLANVVSGTSINKDEDILHIVTMTDGSDRVYRDANGNLICQPATPGTIDSQAFDIVTIADDAIHFTRIGSGNDRVVYLTT